MNGRLVLETPVCAALVNAELTAASEGKHVFFEKKKQKTFIRFGFGLSG
jgi:hypothetical protein